MYVPKYLILITKSITKITKLLAITKQTKTVLSKSSYLLIEESFGGVPLDVLLVCQHHQDGEGQE